MTNLPYNPRRGIYYRKPAVCRLCDRAAGRSGLCPHHRHEHYAFLKAHGLRPNKPRAVGPERLLIRRLKKILSYINARCCYPKTNGFKYYGGKGIRNFLTLLDLRFLWQRDRADLLKQPSIDRKNTSLHYTLDNCRFIEVAENRNWHRSKK